MTLAADVSRRPLGTNPLATDSVLLRYCHFQHLPSAGSPAGRFHSVVAGARNRDQVEVDAAALEPTHPAEVYRRLTAISDDVIAHARGDGNLFNHYRQAPPVVFQRRLMRFWSVGLQRPSLLVLQRRSTCWRCR
jgi:hypothetical protein